MQVQTPYRYKTIRPSSTLQNYVDCFWFGELDTAHDELFTYNAIATSKTELLFHYQGNLHTENSGKEIQALFKAGFHGQRSLNQRYFSLSKKVGIFGIRFYSHAIPALFSVPASELSNQSLDIHSLLGNKGCELAESVFTSTSNDEKVKLVSGFLESRIQQQKPKLQTIERAIFKIHRSHGQISMDDLVDHSLLSQRQFERNFKELAGFSPKSYLRIVRFEAALSAFQKTKRSFTKLALDAGYFDQAHFNRDFKAYTGLSPLNYFHTTCPV